MVKSLARGQEEKSVQKVSHSNRSNQILLLRHCQHFPFIRVHVCISLFLFCVCRYVCDYVSGVSLQSNRKNNKRTKQICERLLLSPSQDRDPELSGVYEITVKWLRTRVGNPCIDTASARRYADNRRHRHEQLHKYTYMHRFVCCRGFGSFLLCFLPSCRRILVVAVRA